MPWLHGSTYYGRGRRCTRCGYKFPDSPTAGMFVQDSIVPLAPPQRAEISLWHSLRRTFLDTMYRMKSR